MPITNPFLKHNKKAQDLATLAKLNHGVTGRVMDVADAMQSLVKNMVNTGKVETLAGVLRVYPGDIRIVVDGNATFVDSGNLRFQLKLLFANWDLLSMSQWIESRFNETEPEDIQMIRDRLEYLLVTGELDATLSMDELMGMLTDYFDEHYPEPQKEIYHSFDGQTMEQKDYYLPALKVLILNGKGEYVSPIYQATWEDCELMATHQSSDSFPFPSAGIMHSVIESDMGRCNCGIYASVNLSEIKTYYQAEQHTAAFTFGMNPYYGQEDRRVCIIEPMSDAVVWTARKGWKSNHVFISEVIGETISFEDASTLLSMVWQRPLDVSTLYRP